MFGKKVMRRTANMRENSHLIGEIYIIHCYVKKKIYENRTKNLLENLLRKY